MHGHLRSGCVRFGLPLCEGTGGWWHENVSWHWHHVFQWGRWELSWLWELGMMVMEALQHPSHHKNLECQKVRAKMFLTMACLTVPQDIQINGPLCACLRISWPSKGFLLPVQAAHLQWDGWHWCNYQIPLDQYIAWGGWHWRLGVIARRLQVVLGGKHSSPPGGGPWRGLFFDNPISSNTPARECLILRRRRSDIIKKTCAFTVDNQIIWQWIAIF